VIKTIKQNKKDTTVNFEYRELRKAIYKQCYRDSAEVMEELNTDRKRIPYSLKVKLAMAFMDKQLQHIHYFDQEKIKEKKESD